jgi:DNA-binding response OmpR family regulator
MLRQDRAEPKTALVVDDDPWVRVMLATILGQAGYLVSLASNGFTGLRLARELVPHVVVLDLVLPEVPGPMVLRELRHHPATCQVPVILMLPAWHAFAPAEVVEADAVLRAPVGEDELLAEVHTLARRRRAAPPTPRSRPAQPPPPLADHIIVSNTLAPVLAAR